MKVKKISAQHQDVYLHKILEWAFFSYFSFNWWKGYIFIQLSFDRSITLIVQSCIGIMPANFLSRTNKLSSSPSNVKCEEVLGGGALNVNTDARDKLL
jgi:hypothetical protein